jgi:hypothetical protein
MPNRRTFELIVVTVILLGPVVNMGRIWFRKHIATSGNESTGVAAEVGLTVL